MHFSVVQLQLICLKIRFTGVIDVAGFRAVKSCVDHVFVVQREEVAVNAETFVHLLALVAHGIANLLTHIFDHDVLRVETKNSVSGVIITYA